MGFSKAESIQVTTVCMLPFLFTNFYKFYDLGINFYLNNEDKTNHQK